MNIPKEDAQKLKKQKSKIKQNVYEKSEIGNTTNRKEHINKKICKMEKHKRKRRMENENWY